MGQTWLERSHDGDERKWVNSVQLVYNENNGRRENKLNVA